VQPVKDLAIVLKSVRFEDRHRIVTALTERNGKVTALARNAVQSRRFGGALEPFSASEWTYVHKPHAELARLDGAEIRHEYSALRSDFGRMAVGSLLCELVLRLAPANEASTDLFKLLSNGLAAVESLPSAEAAGPLLNAYLAKIMQWAGVQPTLHACLECGTVLDSIQDLASDPGLACLVADAGWICPACRGTSTRFVRLTELGAANRVEVPASALLDLYTGVRLPIRRALENAHASAPAHEALGNYLTGLLAYHVPGFDRSELKSLRFLPRSSG
jgi:DNA repair protein RecO